MPYCKLLLLLIIMRESTVKTSNATIYLRNICDSKESMRIVEGVPALPGEIPYQVSFKHYHSRNLYKSFCGGVIIKSNVILSAAHCFASKLAVKRSKLRSHEYDNILVTKLGILGYGKVIDYSSIYAYAGSIVTYSTLLSDSNEEGQCRRISNVILHPEYNFPFFDVSLVGIHNHFIFGPRTSAIPLAKSNIDYFNTCLISGFGMLTWKSLSPSNTLMKTCVKPSIRRQCDVFGDHTNEFICIQYSKQHVSRGDSGGGMLCTDSGDPNDDGSGVVVGIACGIYVDKNVSLYTRVSAHAGFIRQFEDEVVAVQIDNDVVAVCLFVTVILGLAIIGVYNESIAEFINKYIE